MHKKQHLSLFSRSTALPVLLSSLITLTACMGSEDAATPGSSAAQVATTPSGTSNTNPSEISITPDTNNENLQGPFVADKYTVANQCFALQSVSTGKFVKKDSSGGYTASLDSLSMASPLFLKPSALGQYLIYTQDSSFMTGSAGAVSTLAAPADQVIWTFQDDGKEVFTLVADQANQKLSVDASGKLVLKPSATSGNASQFKWVKTTGCTEYPEIGTNTEGETFKGDGVQKPALGFADVHNHLTTTHFLGGVHHGSPFHKFGVTHALGDCQENHGQDGRMDIVGNFLGGAPTDTHVTKGYPDFASWPAPKSLSHEGLYYKWLERSWKAGLRLFVTNLVENEVLCKLVSATKKKPTANCNEMDSAVSQIADTYAVQNYIDAQSGGPGKGWFRVVTSPAQAREVINQGKLAVVLGIEISHLFNCTYRNGVDGCTTQSIDQEIEKLHRLGVRQMFPIHEFNNAMGGNGIFDGLVLNGGNFLDTGEFWKTYDCPEDKYLYSAGAIMGTAVPGTGNDPLSQAILAQTNGRAPFYKADKKQCNARGLTPIGQYAFAKMMQKKMIIEIDHLELTIKSDLLSLAEAQSPQYPVVSTHGGHGGISEEQARRIFKVGGIIYSYHSNGDGWVGFLKRATEFKSDKYQFAIGYGADTNGLGSQAGPRGKNDKPVVYPFDLFKGDAFSDPKFSKVSSLKFQQQQSGNKKYDVNTHGQAHYGMKADFVEEVRLIGGRDAINSLYDSAEVYLQMWERTVKR